MMCCAGYLPTLCVHTYLCCPPNCLTESLTAELWHGGCIYALAARLVTLLVMLREAQSITAHNRYHPWCGRSCMYAYVCGVRSKVLCSAQA
ncbi:hypothetical protein GGS24DRAFT_475901 [Hypoxylon argillaceum]|nr:hypothetical protein GGS24DRAFT_475901 [Hypoxylon argillaceum]KAI1155647.1 hypothetical protein F4825DRAFT_406849 [Nemania diffusa]